MPTETVYGLAGDARRDDVVAAIFAAKGRPAANPLIAHYLDVDAAGRDAQLDARARALAERFWPGPLTLVASRTATCAVCQRASAGLATIAVRCPDHPATRTLLQACGFPLVAPSANPSGELSPVTAGHVAERLGDRIDWILDGGRTRRGVESTVVDVSVDPPEILRAGTVTREALIAAVGDVGESGGGGDAPRAPGSAFRHYAPRCPVLLGPPPEGAPDEALVTFGSAPAPAGYGTVMNLSECGDLEEAAANLFAVLHELEAQGVRRIRVVPIPDEGVGRAINDRLRRAAEASGA